MEVSMSGLKRKKLSDTVGIYTDSNVWGTVGLLKIIEGVARGWGVANCEKDIATLEKFKASSSRHYHKS